ncbi:Oidioi.mRNA.OKI2018_I69.PAR.g13026.t1.cds [Oikopleura dioica]|uniref:Oidioi.mRNA.OKI2018_I69.PAR.g13026.t1.cds n=1 Tax=Oikopleura dioica TaxID=34765 RepID=A0ABN7S870_OIKDI|nr:Oidioi.mRNA.OKI2018_I69.PAR.g13026.t1.cds [Oikopleura dioica]
MFTHGEGCYRKKTKSSASAKNNGSSKLTPREYIDGGRGANDFKTPSPKPKESSPPPLSPLEGRKPSPTRRRGEYHIGVKDCFGLGYEYRDAPDEPISSIAVFQANATHPSLQLNWQEEKLVNDMLKGIETAPYIAQAASNPDRSFIIAKEDDGCVRYVIRTTHGENKCRQISVAPAAAQKNDSETEEIFTPTPKQRQRRYSVSFTSRCAAPQKTSNACLRKDLPFCAGEKLRRNDPRASDIDSKAATVQPLYHGVARFEQKIVKDLGSSADPEASKEEAKEFADEGSSWCLNRRELKSICATAADSVRGLRPSLAQTGFGKFLQRSSFIVSSDSDDVENIRQKIISSQIDNIPEDKYWTEPGKYAGPKKSWEVLAGFHARFSQDLFDNVYIETLYVWVRFGKSTWKLLDINDPLLGPQSILMTAINEFKMKPFFPWPTFFKDDFAVDKARLLLALDFVPLPTEPPAEMVWPEYTTSVLLDRADEIYHPSSPAQVQALSDVIEIKLFRGIRALPDHEMTAFLGSSDDEDVILLERFAILRDRFDQYFGRDRVQSTAVRGSSTFVEVLKSLRAVLPEIFRENVDYIPTNEALQIYLIRAAQTPASEDGAFLALFGLSSPIPAKFFKQHSFEVFPQSQKRETFLPFAVKSRQEIITAFKAKSPELLKVLGEDAEPFLESKFKYDPVRRLPEHKPADDKKEASDVKDDSNNNNGDIVYISSDDAPAKHLSDDDDRSDSAFFLDCPSTSSEDEIVAPKIGGRFALLSSEEEL